MKQLLLNACITLAALTTIVCPASAGPPRDVSAEIAAQRADFVSAKVYHVADSLSFRTRRQEQDIAKGCHYAASGADLAALLDVLAAAGLHEATSGIRNFEARTAIYLARRDASTVPLVLTLRFPVNPSYGTYTHSVPVEAAAAFSAALHAWMDARTEIDPTTSQPCTDIFNH